MINYIHNIPFFCIFLSMIAGIITPLMKGGKMARKINIVVTMIIGIMSCILLMSFIDGGESFNFMMGHYPAPWGNELRAGPFEALMAVVFSLVMMLSIIGNKDSLEEDIPPKKQKYYYVMINLLLSSLLALIYTNDIFTAYVFIEINTIAACAIVMAKEGSETIRATLRYLIMSTLGSGLILISIALIYDLTGHLLMQNIGVSVAKLMESGEYIVPLTVALGLLTIGLCVKSALFPFGSWLPDAHGSATSASSAILSGLVVKGYIILLIKIFYRVFGVETIKVLNISNVLFFLGVLGMIMGSVYAIKQSNIKRMIAYSSIAQIGYIFMGIGLGTEVGMIAAVFHMIAHALTKPMLFTAAGGLINCSNHSKELKDLKGSAYKNRIAGIAMIVGALSMIGIPLLSGFVSKFYFAQAAFDNPEKVMVTLLVLGLSAVLNAMYYIPMIIVIYTPDDRCDTKNHVSISKGFKVSLTCFIVCNFIVGIGYAPIMDIIEKGLNMFS